MPASASISQPLSAIRLASQLWFSCPSCKGELKVPIELADTRAACPLCGALIAIPSASSVPPPAPKFDPPAPMLGAITGPLGIHLGPPDDEFELTNLFSKQVKVPLEYSIIHPCLLHRRDAVQPGIATRHETAPFESAAISRTGNAGQLKQLSGAPGEHSLGHPCRPPLRDRVQPGLAGGQGGGSSKPDTRDKGNVAAVVVPFKKAAASMRCSLGNLCRLLPRVVLRHRRTAAAEISPPLVGPGSKGNDVAETKKSSPPTEHSLGHPCRLPQRVRPQLRETSLVPPEPSVDGSLPPQDPVFHQGISFDAPVHEVTPGPDHDRGGTREREIEAASVSPQARQAGLGELTTDPELANGCAEAALTDQSPKSLLWEGVTVSAEVFVPWPSVSDASEAPPVISSAPAFVEPGPRLVLDEPPAVIVQPAIPAPEVHLDFAEHPSGDVPAPFVEFELQSLLGDLPAVPMGAGISEPDVQGPVPGSDVDGETATIAEPERCGLNQAPPCIPVEQTVLWSDDRVHLTEPQWDPAEEFEMDPEVHGFFPETPDISIAHFAPHLGNPEVPLVELQSPVQGGGQHCFPIENCFVLPEPPPAEAPPIEFEPRGFLGKLLTVAPGHGILQSRHLGDLEEHATDPGKAPFVVFDEGLQDSPETQPAVLGNQTAGDDEEEPPQVRIGGVLLPRYTLVPRANQPMLWLRRAAILAVIISPFVWFSDFYMPRVRRVAAWLDETRRTRITFTEMQEQAAYNRSSPAAQGFKEDAFGALRQQWTKLTTPAAPSPAIGSKARQVVFRSTRSDPSVHNPTAGWPQLLLRNHGTFHGHSAMEGASSFLLEAEDGGHWIATSVHLLGASGGVEPPLNPGKLAADLDRWRACLPNQQDSFAEVVGGTDLVSIVTADWLAMQLPPGNAPLPVKPLKLRRSLLAADETVYLIGLPYDDNTGVSQYVYRGKVILTSQAKPSQFAFTVDATVDFSGFRGAPVLDADGLVVGVMTDRWADLLVGTRAELLAQLLEAK